MAWQKLYGRKKWNKWHGFDSVSLSAFADEYRQVLLDNKTMAEKEMEKILETFGLIFFPQKIFLFKKKFRIVDFYFPEKNLAIEIDGYQHFTKKGYRYDKMRSGDLRSRFHLKIIRFTNSDVLKNRIKVEKELMGIFFKQDNDELSRSFFATTRG